MRLTKDLSATLDFFTLPDEVLSSALTKNQITFSIKVGRQFQREVLQRPPTILECLLWSMQLADCVSCHRVSTLLNQLDLCDADVLCLSENGIGGIVMTKDHMGIRYGVVMRSMLTVQLPGSSPKQNVSADLINSISHVTAMGAEPLALASTFGLSAIDCHQTQWFHDRLVTGAASASHAMGVVNVAGSASYDDRPWVPNFSSILALGSIGEDRLINACAPEQASGFDLIWVGMSKPFTFVPMNQTIPKSGSNIENGGSLDQLWAAYLMKAHQILSAHLHKKACIDQVGCRVVGTGGILRACLALVESVGLGVTIALHNIDSLTASWSLNMDWLKTDGSALQHLWVVPKTLTQFILQHYNELCTLTDIFPDAGAIVIGQITETRYFRIQYQDTYLVNMKIEDFFIETPLARINTEDARKADSKEPRLALPKDLNDMLLKLLAHENIASCEMIYEHYDKQVQGQVVLELGRADAGVLRPFVGEVYPEELENIGVALALDHNGRYPQIDPYWAAVNAVANSARRVACVGADPYAMVDHLGVIGLSASEQQWVLSELVRGMVDACQSLTTKDDKQVGIPILTGDTVLENLTEKKAHSTTITLYCLGTLENSRHAICGAFKQAKSCVILVGERKSECGGGVYYQLHQKLGRRLPQPDMALVNRQIHALTEAIDCQYVLAASTIAKGGVAVAIAKMCIPNVIGVMVDIPGRLSIDKLLFTETGGFILEVPQAHLEKVKDIFAHFGCDVLHIGMTTSDRRIQIQGEIDLSIPFAAEAYQQGLREKLL